MAAMEILLQSKPDERDISVQQLNNVNAKQMQRILLYLLILLERNDENVKSK